MKQMSLPFWTLLNAGFAVVGREWNYRNVCSPFTRLYYITSGKGYIELTDRTILLQPGYFYIVPAFTVHSDYCPESMGHYYLHIYEEADGHSTMIADSYIFPDYMDPQRSLVRIFEEVVRNNIAQPLKQTDPKDYDNYTGLAVQIENDFDLSLSERVMNNGMVSLIMGYWLRAAEKKSSVRYMCIARVMDFIQQNLFNDFSLEDCAAAVSMSRFHLLRQFKSVVGTSLMNYVQFLRMRRAQTELVMTNKSIKSIAAELGYADVNYFIRLFRKQTSFTPREYRRNNMV